VIRYAWHDVLPTDGALAAGEWAGVRVSTAAEGRVVGASRKSVCSTFLFRGCGHVLRLIVCQDDLPKLSFFRRVSLPRAIRDAVARNAPNVDRPLSTAILATAAALVPEALPELYRVSNLRRCEACTCVFRENGPAWPNSPQRRYIEAHLAQSKFAKRNAA
jgi:hypothetical protein